jgi:hypothetical protein
MALTLGTLRMISVAPAEMAAAPGDVTNAAHSEEGSIGVHPPVWLVSVAPAVKLPLPSARATNHRCWVMLTLTAVGFWISLCNAFRETTIDS